MLHEVLLALSGHPSPLFKDAPAGPDGEVDNDPSPLLSPSEDALLQTLGRLSGIHRKLRRHIDRIASKRPSTICRAVATSIQQIHLARFQQKILDVEASILTRGVTIVGAYDIVPLAGVVAEFEEWQRLMAWYWDVACFMLPDESKQASSRSSSGCTGAALIDKLRSEQQTGYSDIERAATELCKIAETAWLRQLASWVLYGRLPDYAAEDFFVRSKQPDPGEGLAFSKDAGLLPKFVTSSTASSILFMGKSLHQVRKYGRQKRGREGALGLDFSDTDMASLHVKELSQLSLPIVPAQLSRAISSIRLSWSRNLLQRLLPVEMIPELLSCLRDLFLLARGDFAVSLIREADERLQARQQSMGRLLQQDPVKALQGLSMKDAEFQQTLLQTWKALASRDDEIEDDALDFARSHVTLTAPPNAKSRPSTSDSMHEGGPDLTTVAFNDLLFPTASSLRLEVSPPLDLFISQEQVNNYSAINAYLLAIRRSHLRLADLWRRTSARRDHPTPPGEGPRSVDTRTRIRKRRIETRKVWATCSAAIFLLSETSAYFEGEIIRESWARFETWVCEPAATESADEASPNPPPNTTTTAQKDPETFAAGHRTFLAALSYALLLTDAHYTRNLRSLLGTTDALTAFFHRLLDVQRKRDLQREADPSASESGFAADEEQRVALELDRARKRVDSDLKSVVVRLRALDQERIGAGRYLDVGVGEGKGGFEPWKGGGVDRLLMKLEFGRMAEAEVGMDVGLV